MTTILEQLIEQYPRGYIDGEGWDVNELSKNTSITMNFIRNHIEGIMMKNEEGELVLTEWNYDYLSRRKDLDWKLVRDYPDKGWNYDYLSRRKDLDWKLVRDYPNKSWYYKHLATRSDLPRWLVKLLPHKFEGLLIKNTPFKKLDLDKLSVKELSSMYLPGTPFGHKVKRARR